MNKSPKTTRRWLNVAHLVALVAVLWLIRALTVMAPPAKSVSYSEFLDELRAGRLDEVEVNDRSLTGKLKPSEKAPKPGTITASRLPGIDDRDLLKEFEERHVKVSGRFESRSVWVEVLLTWFLPLLVLAGIYQIVMRRLAQTGGNVLTFGRNKAKIHDQSETSSITFKDVAGVDEAKVELEEVIDFLRQPDKYQKLGGRIPKGVLLVGPPGTGKTLLAKAVAGEAGVSFFSISGSEFVEMFVGVGAARVRDLFEQARQKAPCIVFIDELDAIGKSRTTGRAIGFANDEREQTLNQLLAEMDGFDTSKGVILMAATNAPEVLDAALLRAGRFDRQVLVDRPDLKDRVEILKVHARKILMSDDVNLEAIAARTPGMVGADLANIVNEAALLAVRRGGERVEMRDFEEAADRVMLGLEKKSRVMSPEEKERVAVHEAGHALVALSVKHADPLHRVSIIPRSIGALGYTLQLPTQERYLMTQPELEDQIAVLLGGRAAEEIHYGGVISTGAADDLQRASELVRQMVMRFGMSDRLGKLIWGRSMMPQFLKSPFEMEERNYSEQTAETIDQELRRILDEIYGRDVDILRKNREPLARISRELIRKETLDRTELDRLLAVGDAVPASASSSHS
ncbi:MAG TPA: ATP-dependent zinc metalloprotease FtsH [Bryobacteraceae bacterium]|nr:ATP-dependent zinc metalloprotease FtsH [Bryobacteraceae bacterium]